MIRTSGKDISKPKEKSEYFCGYYKNGFCPYGNSCKSIHDRNPRRFYPAIPCKYFLKNEPCKNKRCWFAHYIPNNYKTTICESFAATGKCPQGEQCTFLHSEGERSEGAHSEGERSEGERSDKNTKEENTESLVEKLDKFLF